MLNQQTVEKLHEMKLHGMADAFRVQLETTQNGQLTFEERFALLVDQQWLWKENRALARRLQTARLKERGVTEDIDYQHPRGLDRKLVRMLATSEWVTQHQNICCSVQLVSGKVGSLAPWRRRLAVTGSQYCIREPRSCAANWPSPTPMAASAGSCSSSHALTFWCWTILLCRR